MRKRILAGAMALAFGASLTTSAIAFDHAGGLHTGIGAIHGGSFAANRMAGVRGYTAWRNGGWGSQRAGSYSSGGYSTSAPTAAWSR
jgi:hypothetical protein